VKMMVEHGFGIRRVTAMESDLEALFLRLTNGSSSSSSSSSLASSSSPSAQSGRTAA